MNWIDIKNKKPKFSDTYIVACDIGSITGGYRSVRAYHYDANLQEFEIIRNSFEVVEITHWMELPKLPEDYS